MKNRTIILIFLLFIKANLIFSEVTLDLNFSNYSPLGINFEILKNKIGYEAGIGLPLGVFFDVYPIDIRTLPVYVGINYILLTHTNDTIRFFLNSGTKSTNSFETTEENGNEKITYYSTQIAIASGFSLTTSVFQSINIDVKLGAMFGFDPYYEYGHTDDDEKSFLPYIDIGIGYIFQVQK